MAARRSVYAAKYEFAPKRQTWALYREPTPGRISRVAEPSDWLLEWSVGYAPLNTVRTKAMALALWWRWCIDTETAPLCASADALSRFIIAMQSVPKDLPLTSEVRAMPGDPRLRSARTVNQTVNHIKQFYVWAYERHPIPKDTLRQISSYRTPSARSRQTAPRLYGEQVAALFRQNLSARDRLLLELLYGAGLREGEALGLRVEDMHLTSDIAEIFGCTARHAGPHLHVVRRANPNGATAKSIWSRIVPLHTRITDAYRDWQAYLFDVMPDAADCGFVLLSTSGTTRGRPLTVPGLWSMWRRIVQPIPGLEESYPHILRHTFASELVDAGVDSFIIQELLGHRHPSSTEVYTHAHAATMTGAIHQLNEWRSTALVGAHA